MAVINILGFFSVTAFLSIRYKEKVVTVIQSALGIWMMLLYILAFFQKLSAIDVLSVLFIVGLIFYIWHKRLSFKAVIVDLLDSSTILLWVTVLIVSGLSVNRMVANFDELAVWGPEPKCLYMIDGFAERYMNLLSGYSAYHPGAMLIEWWTCHFQPHEFHEGFLYVGFWFIILCYIAPVFEGVHVKRMGAAILAIPVSVVLVLLPSMFGKMNYCLIAEMPMSMVFAGCLLSCFDGENHSRKFQFLRFTTNVACLMLIKESGVIFAVFILVFYFLSCGFRQKRKASVSEILYGIVGFGVAAIPTFVWKIYCIVTERNNYFASAFDGTVDSIKTQTFTFSEDLPKYGNSMLKAWITQPLHIDTTCGLDLTPILAVLLVLLLSWYCVRINVVEKKMAIRFFYLYVGAIFIFMIMLLFMHTYIFGEGQYLEPEKMIYSIGRYAEPFFLGCFIYFVILILRKAESGRLQLKRWLVVAIIVFMCSDVSLAKAYMFDYAVMNTEMIEAQNEVMEQEAVLAFVNEVENHLDEKQQARILWISDKEDSLAKIGQTRTFLYMFAPKTYFYSQVNLESQNSDGLEDFIREQVVQQHFSYIYLDFSDSREWQLSETQTLQNNTLYRIFIQGDSVCIANVDE